MSSLGSTTSRRRSRGNGWGGFGWKSSDYGRNRNIVGGWLGGAGLFCPPSGSDPNPCHDEYGGQADSHEKTWTGRGCILDPRRQSGWRSTRWSQYSRISISTEYFGLDFAEVAG